MKPKLHAIDDLTIRIDEGTFVIGDIITLFRNGQTVVFNKTELRHMLTFINGVNEDKDAKLIQIVLENKFSKLQAVKAVKDYTGWGLKEAKGYTDNVWESVQSNFIQEKFDLL